MDVTLKFRGDVIIYDRDEVWNFVFITDGNHRCRLAVNGTPFAELRNKRDRELRIEIANLQTRNRLRGTKSETILNMADLHGTDGSGSKLKRVKRSPGGRELIHLRVPVGELSAISSVPNYWWEEFEGNESGELDETATQVALDFRVGQSPGASVTLKDHAAPDIGSWNHAAALELSFDNDCSGHGDRNDFLHYYDAVKEKDGPQKSDRKFIAGKGDLRMKGLTGNCDPVFIDPPPDGDV